MLQSLLILSLPSVATAADTDIETFTLSSTLEIIPSTEVDSGWWPESGPVRVRTVLTAEGAAEITMDGESVLQQCAGGLTQTLVPADDGGLLDIGISVLASLWLSLDVAGYTYEDVIKEEGLNIEQSRTFEAFAYAAAGEGEQVDFIMDPVELFEIEQGILPLVDVVVTANLTSTAIVNYATDAITVDDFEFTSDGQKRILSDAFHTTLSGSGQANSVLELLVEGHAEVCITWVDCYGDFDFDFPLDPIEHEQAVIFDAVSLAHTRPSTGPAATCAEESEGEPKAGESGGCATAPFSRGHGFPILLLMVLAACGGRRRPE